MTYLRIAGFTTLILFLVIVGNWAGYALMAVRPGLALLFWIIIQLTVFSLLYGDYQDIKRKRAKLDANQS